MPIDPATGQRLPYAGEPGAPAGAPPTPAGGPGAPPPGGPGAPPPGAEPTPEELAALEAENASMRGDIMAEAAPQPEKPYSVKAIDTLIGDFNDTLEALAGTELPDVEWQTPEGAGAKWPNPLPPEIFVPLVALTEALKVVGDGSFYEKHGFEPMELTSDAELRKASASMRKMAKDSDLAEAMQAPMGAAGPGAPPESEEMPPPPGGFEEEDELLAQNLT